jgi:hypothetical protein
MRRVRAALGLIAVAAAGALLLSGGSGADPRTPRALPGLPPPFLGTAVVGDGGLTAAIDAYGDVVDLRPAPAGRALIENPSDRQAAGTVPSDTGIVPTVSIDEGRPLPLWRADAVRQRYLPRTNVLLTEAQFAAAKVAVAAAASGAGLAIRVRAWPSPGHVAKAGAGIDLIGSAGCRRSPTAEGFELLCAGGQVLPRTDPDALIQAALAGDRRWLRRARPLAAAAPGWAVRLYERSLLVLRALSDRRTGALAAGARDGWAYVWPRDAATGALAFEAAGYVEEARRVARFLDGLELDAAARFEGDGNPVPDRGPQGDAPGWVALAARAAGIPLSAGSRAATASIDPTDAPDYQEGPAGDYLANALSRAGEPKPRVDGREMSSIPTFQDHRQGVTGILARFGTAAGLGRRAGDRGLGLDSAAAWAVRPFARPALFGAARETLVRLLDQGTRFGITPGEGWDGEDPWTAPTAWSAWAFAALVPHEAGESTLAHADRHRALRLLAGLRHAATPAGELPERVDVRTGVPRSTTPLAWSHAFAILALRELWPAR